MFPNPTTGKVSLTVGSDVTTQMTVTVYNVLGAQVIEPVTYKAGTTNMVIDVTSVANGVYFVKVQGNNTTAIKQLTVSH